MLATAPLNLADMTLTDIVAEMLRAEHAADAARSAGDRSTEVDEHNRMVAAMGEMMDRGYITDAAVTHVGAKVRGTATGRIGTVSETFVTGEVTVDWGSVQVPGFPNSRYSTFTTEILSTGGLIDAYMPYTA